MDSKSITGSSSDGRDIGVISQRVSGGPVGFRLGAIFCPASFSTYPSAEDGAVLPQSAGGQSLVSQGIDCAHVARVERIEHGVWDLSVD